MHRHGFLFGELMSNVYSSVYATIRYIWNVCTDLAIPRNPFPIALDSVNYTYLLL